MSLAKQIKNSVLEEYQEELDQYRSEVLGSDHLPKDTKIQRDFTTQQLFGSDGMFMRYIKDVLVKNGKLNAVLDNQRRSVSQILILK